MGEDTQEVERVHYYYFIFFENWFSGLGVYSKYTDTQTHRKSRLFIPWKKKIEDYIDDVIIPYNHY